ncbi:hypothetical protein N9891_00095 [bacterium]|nr:hypothetical protein [bacterium]
MKILFEPKGSAVVFGNIKDEWFLELAHLGVNTKLAREVDGQVIVKVGGETKLDKRFYERVRKPDSWLPEFIAESRSEFEKIIHKSGAGKKWTIWLDEKVDVHVQKVDRNDQNPKPVESTDELENIAVDVSVLYKQRSTKFEVYCNPRGAFNPRIINSGARKTGVKDGDFMYIEFNTDGFADIVVFVITVDGVVRVHPDLENGLISYGHQPGRFERSRTKTNFRYPKSDGFEVVMDRDPYIFLVAAKYGEKRFFSEEKIGDIYDGLEEMREKVFSSPESKECQSYDPCRKKKWCDEEGLLGKDGWLRSVSAPLSKGVDFSRLTVVPPAR